MGTITKKGKPFYDKQLICPKCGRRLIWSFYTYKNDGRGNQRKQTWECNGCSWSNSTSYKWLPKKKLTKKRKKSIKKWGHDFGI